MEEISLAVSLDVRLLLKEWEWGQGEKNNSTSKLIVVLLQASFGYSAQ